jgi:hypothetical protein
MALAMKSLTICVSIREIMSMENLKELANTAGKMASFTKANG